MGFRHAMLAVGALVVLAGCAGKQEANESTATTLPPADAPAGHPASADEQVSTEGSVADLLARVDQEAVALDQVIASAQLSSVHKKAFAIRDLAVAAGNKAQVPASSKAQLEAHLVRIRTLAEALDKSGDGGDLGATKASQAELHAEIDALKKLLAPFSH